MKNLIAITALALSAVTAQAHTTRALPRPTNSALAQFKQTVEGLATEYVVTDSLKVTRVQPAQRPNETDEALFRRVLASTLHRDYPITGDDGGYGMSRMTTANPHSYSVEQIVEFLSRDNSADDAYAFVEHQLLSAVQGALDAGLIVLDGGGSGNNTFSYFVAVYDPATKEFAYIMYSNFGSES